MPLNDDEFDEMSGYSGISADEENYDFQSDDFSNSDDNYIADSPDFADDVDFTQNLVQPSGAASWSDFSSTPNSNADSQTVAVKTHSKHVLVWVIAGISILVVLGIIFLVSSKSRQGDSAEDSSSQITLTATIPATIVSHYWTSIIDVSDGYSTRSVTRSEYGLDPLWGEYTLAPGEQVTNYYVVYSLVCNTDAGQVYFSTDEISWRNNVDGAYVNLVWHSDSQTYSLY